MPLRLLTTPKGRRASGWTILVAAIVLGFARQESTTDRLDASTNEIHQLQEKQGDLIKSHRRTAKRVTIKLCESQNDNKDVLRNLLAISVRVAKEEGRYTPRQDKAYQEFLSVLNNTNCKKLPEQIAQP